MKQARKLTEYILNFLSEGGKKKEKDQLVNYLDAILADKNNSKGLIKLKSQIEELISEEKNIKNRFVQEYEYIKSEVLNLSKEEIFERAFFINFYTEMYNFLKYLSEEEIAKYKLENSSIYNLFEFFMSDDIYSINTKEEIIDFLDKYSKRRGA